MAPVASSTAGDTDTRCILNALVTLGTLNVNSKTLIEAEDVSRSDHT